MLITSPVPDPELVEARAAKRAKRAAEGLDGTDSDEEQSMNMDTQGVDRMQTEQAGSPLFRLLQRMPLDILTEISSHLPPETLLNLCRSARYFRSLLLSPAGRSLWVASRLKTTGIPTLQYNELDEVQYAVFLFGKQVCQVRFFPLIDRYTKQS